ncbi:universal stress protein [Limibacter armeniacum]|uniref:universal stress protein n=1 Tax=Limibacter armeniacum TaxID=466084 RepID=UPI002FE53C3F
MKVIDHIIVGLDLSTMDGYLLEYAAFISNKLGADKISFLHVTPTFSVFDELEDDWTEEEIPDSLEEIIKEELSDRVQKYFHPKSKTSIEQQVVVLEGDTTEQFIRYAVTSNADLLLLGKKSGLKGAGLILKQVISLSPCSVMLASELAPHSIDNIMLPLNFSSNSILAYERAEMLSKYFGANYFMQFVNTEVTLTSLLKTKIYTFSEKEKEAFKGSVEKEAKAKYKKFLKKIGKTEDEMTDIKFTVNTDGDPAYTIYRYAIKRKADLILLGAGIRSSYSNLFLDSISEKLAAYDSTIPVYIVKNKERNLKNIHDLF